MFIVQNLLTELISIKNPFLETKNKMIEKIENNCYKYYKYTIQIKQIYDYCALKKPENSINYVLLKGKEAADKVAAEYKDQADKPIVVSVVFRPGNAMGEAEKADIVIKKYTFTPVN